MLALGLLILRLVIGLTVAAHGAQKLFGWWGGPGMTTWTQVVTRLRIRPAKPWAWVAALSEFGGGLLVAFGFLTPLGCVAIRLIASAVPVTRAVPTLLVTELPWTTVRLLGNARIAKSDGAAVTFTVTDTLCVLEPSTPVTVTV